MTTYIVTRIATQNPDINGRKLYLTDIDLWSLDAKYARKFLNRQEAKRCARPDANVERA